MAISHKLSLPAAIMINLNIMVGVGLFLNTSILATMTGAAGWISYATLAVLLLPLILSIARLVHIYPDGGFYTYSAQQMSPLIGFISAWSYFTAKLASAMLMIHASILLLQQIIHPLAQLHTFSLDIVILTLFLGLNLLHVKAGSSIQALFLIMKFIPICFVLLSGLFLLSGGNYCAAQFHWEGFLGTLPLVLYSAVGFEATTSLSRNIDNAHINGPRAILISYILVMLINILYQFFFYGSLGQQLAQAANFLEAFPLLITRFFGSHMQLKYMLQGLFNIAIASSALGGAYGILFSNSWNLYTLAQHGHVLRSKFFVLLNRFNIPYVCIAAEGVIALFFLFACQARQIPMQQITAFGCSIAYSLSVISLMLYAYRHNRSMIIPFLGCINCFVLLISCLYSFITLGAVSLTLFSMVLLFGLIMFFTQSMFAHYSS